MITNWLFPPRCMNCNCLLPLHRLGNVFLCQACADTIDYADNSKTNCHAVMNYGDTAQNLIFHFKYWGHPEYSKSLGTMMYESVSHSDFFEKIDLLIPVPIHKTRLKKRGYNQAQLLSKQISRLSGIRENAKALARVKMTESQNALNYNERIQNLKDSMKVLNPAAITGKNLLLIDDIYTTGATMQCCEDELINCNPNSIFRLALAIVNIEPHQFSPTEVYSINMK